MGDLIQSVVQGGESLDFTFSDTGTATVPANTVYLIHSWRATFVADANASARVVEIAIRDTADAIALYFIRGDVTANITKSWQWGPTNKPGTAVPTDYEEMLQSGGPYLMYPAMDFRVTLTNKLAGDTFTFRAIATIYRHGVPLS